MLEQIDNLTQPERLAAIAASDLLDTGAIPALDRVVGMAARMLKAPVAQLNVVTEDRQIPVSSVGGDAWSHPVELGNSYCQQAIRSGEPLVVEDAREHPLGAASSATRGDGVGAYLSVPIFSPRAPDPLATLCVVDFRPRAWTAQEVDTLGGLAAWALSEIELRAAYRRDRLRVEKARRSSEARMRAVYDGTFEYIGLLAPDGTVLDCNRASLEFAGNSREDVVGSKLWDTPWFADTPGAPDGVRHAIERAASGEFVRYQVTLHRPRGESLTFDFSLYPIRNDRGEVVFIVPEGRDVTEAQAIAAERERLVADLAVERARLVEVIRSAPALMVVLRGPDHVLELANDAYLQLIGHRDVVGRPLFEAMPDLRGQGFEALLGQVLTAGEPYHGRGIPVRIQRTPDAPLEERVLDLAFVPLTEADGSRSGLFVLGTDVTDEAIARHEAELARDRAERLQALTAALARARTLDDVADVVVADMVVALGARTGALAAPTPEGDAMVLLRTVGFPETVGSRVARQPLQLQSPLTECFLTRAPVWIESREGPSGLDTRYPPIAPVWDVLGVASAAFVPLIAGGETAGVISFAFERPRVFTDEEQAFLLTLGRQAALAVERARLFEAERAARAEAERANRGKSEFLAMMSHELRTPLNAIGGYVELIEMGIRGPVSAEQREDLHRIQNSQRHLLGLINEVLNYAKIETGTVRYDLDQVRLGDVLESTEHLIAPQAAAKEIELILAPCKPELVVRVDAEKTRQIFVNLLSNAIKFTDRGGRVDLSCAVEADQVRVQVRDTGIGISAEHIDRIFDPFVQVRSDLTRTAEGTGLGLAISRDLARGMGGELTARSRLGEGSIFTLMLPLA
jgi:PAS domain S-box-containing protein